MSDDKSQRNKPPQIAFLLSQIGGRSAQEFARLLGPLQLTPPDAGILRIVWEHAGISQQNLSKALRMHPSRLVGVIDALEKRGLIVREPNVSDRRLYSLRLTAQGEAVFRSIGELAREHNKLICTGLNSAECAQLESLLQKIAGAQGLAPGVHPGYRELGKARRRTGKSD